MTRSIIDISHYEAPVDFQKVAGARIVAVIAKATQGPKFIDPAYAGFKQDAATFKFLWGSYHFGTGEDVPGQVDHYLGVVNPGEREFVCLDLEKNPKGTTMTQDQAGEFVSLLHEQLGRWPVLYGGGYLKDILAGNPDATLSKCPLWLSQYGPKPVLPPGWRKFTLWQYTDGEAGPRPHEVSGIGPCDRSQYNGTIAQLRKAWPLS